MRPILAAIPFRKWEWDLALRYLKAKRKDGGISLIAGISFAAVTLAVAALIIVMSIMNGFRAEIISKMIGFNGHIYVHGPGLASEVLRKALIQQIKTVPEVAQVIPVVQAEALILAHDQVTGGIVRGLDPKDLAHTPILSQHIVAGDFKAFGQGNYGGDNLLIGSGMAEHLSLYPGDELDLISPTGASTAFGNNPRRKTYQVEGLFKVGLTQYDQAFVYMPLTQAQLFFDRGEGVDLLEVNVKDPDQIDKIRPKIQAVIGPDVTLSDWRDENRGLFTALQVERVAMRLILMIVVAIAMLNIISGLVMLSKNKSRDIAILRTLGADSGAILRIFLMIGSLIGLSGAGFGLGLGVLFCAYITPIQTWVERITGVSVFSPDAYFLPHLPAKIDFIEVVVVILWSLFMSLVAALVPAWQASRLQPVEALRYE